MSYGRMVEAEDRLRAEIAEYQRRFREADALEDSLFGKESAGPDLPDASLIVYDDFTFSPFCNSEISMKQVYSDDGRVVMDSEFTIKVRDYPENSRAIRCFRCVR